MADLDSYTSHPGAVDVAVVGAGINGLAIAREAARRGLSVLLIDQDDIAARTSSISTRLIHGGLKYLERFEVHLVYESIRERNILLRRAPHLVQPYPMLIPFAKGNQRPGWLLSCGLLLHEILSIGKPLPLSRIVLRKRLRRDFPAIAAGGVRWGGLFSDANVALTERLSVEMAIDAQAHGATVLTHSRVEAVVRERGRIVGIEYRDRVDGEIKRVDAKIVVNVAGPWVDELLDLTGEHTRQIGATKGSHIVVDPFPGAPSNCIFFESPDDGRPMFVLPWLGRYMIGTTDLPYHGSIDEIVADPEESDYLLRAVNTLISGAHLVADDVLWSYSGVRPLPYVADLDDPSKVSRDHEIIVHDGDRRGLITIVGGKWTTHRALGELVGRRIEKQLGRRPAPSPTREADLPGSPGHEFDRYVRDYVAGSALEERTARRLATIYGSRAGAIEGLVTARPELGAVVDDDTGAIAAEAVHAVKAEGAHTLEDVVLRRMTVGLNGDVGLTAAPVIAEVLVNHAGWTPERAASEVQRYRHAMQRFTPRALRRSTAPR